MMSDSQEHEHYELEQGVQAQREAQGLEDEQVPAAKEVGAAAASSSALMPGILEEVPATGTPSPPQSLLKADSSSTSIQATLSSKSNEGSSGQEFGELSTRPAHPDSEFLLTNVVEKKVAELVRFMGVKYTEKEPITEAEMLKSVSKEYDEYFPMIFKSACEYMEVVFGIEVKEVDPIDHSYVLIKALDLTYDGRLSGEQDMPRTGLLMLILGVIFMEGNLIPEEKIWEVLRMIGVCAEKKDFIFGDPRKLVSEDLVQEGYLESRQVPNSDPARYEFLWGPRAHAETTRMKVLEFFSKVSGSNPTSFAALYKEALRDDEEKAQLVVTTMADTTAEVPEPSPEASPALSEI